MVWLSLLWCDDGMFLGLYLDGYLVWLFGVFLEWLGILGLVP